MTEVRPRLSSIDALRGLVMLIMLLDHVRETFFLHRQVGDPVDAASVEVSLFFMRFCSSFCPSAFVVLTGLGAWLYGRTRSKKEVSSYLLKRGIFLVVLEMLVVTPAWTGEFPPQTIYLQVIWAIGLSMIALAGLLHLPRAAQLAVAVVIICGHNLLTGIRLESGDLLHPLWAVVYQRDWLEIGELLRARTSYPVLPWVGVILLGYSGGAWFGAETQSAARCKRLLLLGGGMILSFLLLRVINLYGDFSWTGQESFARTLMAFFALTKYPASLQFLLLTLGVSSLALVFFEKMQSRPWLKHLATFGAAPMFFYLLHLYVLKALYLGAVTLFGTNQGKYFGFDSIGWIWVWTIGLSVPLYFATRAFAQFKKRRRDLSWLSYF